jgi:hypothetical protein
MHRFNETNLMLTMSSPDSAEDTLLSFPFNSTARSDPESPSDTTRSVDFRNYSQLKSDNVFSRTRGEHSTGNDKIINLENIMYRKPQDQYSLKSSASSTVSRKSRTRRVARRATPFDSVSTLSRHDRPQLTDAYSELERSASFASWALELFPWIISVIWMIILLISYPE